MTYLFDAKYRIDGKVNGVDTPPEDAINQMHRKHPMQAVLKRLQ